MKKILGEEMLTVRDLMEILPMTGQTIRAYIKDGKLQAKKLGQLYYVSKTDFLAFLGDPDELPPKHLRKPIKQTKIVFNQMYVINKNNYRSFRFLRALVRGVLSERTRQIKSEKSEKFILEISFERWTESHQIIVRLDNRKKILWMILYDWKLEGQNIGEKPSVFWVEREDMKCSELDKKLLVAIKKQLTHIKAEVKYLTFKPSMRKEPVFPVKLVEGLEANVALKDNESREGDN